MSVFGTLWQLFERGGWMMWPILVASVLALTVAIERFWMLRRSRVLPGRTVDEVLRLVRAGRIDEARAVCRADGSPFAEIALAGLDWWGHGFEAVREAIADAGRREAPRLIRGLGLVGTVASVAPLMGLLGTVLGMIEVFRTISLTGPGGGEGLSSGIAVALLTTAFGLSVGIPSLVLYNVLSSRAERLVLAMEAACHEIVRSAQPEAASTIRAAAEPEGIAAAGGGDR
ncbi:MAG: MotA/TolQ/ExbB proton channel family protein [Acidobacteriota bacterium]|nr:MAG: MotA/TolQ/ExbB proton channel family protein [Acidobacteriota bacterium]